MCVAFCHCSVNFNEMLFQVSSFVGLAELEPGAPSVLKSELSPVVSVYSVEVCSQLNLNRVPPHTLVLQWRLVVI